MKTLLLFICVLLCSVASVNSKVFSESDISTVCGRDCDFIDLNRAIAGTKTGGTIYIKSEELKVCGYINKSLRIIGEIKDGVRPHLKGVSCHGKGALIIEADNVEISNLEISDINVSDNNGACIRIGKKAKKIIIKNLYCHDSQNGILASFGNGNLHVSSSIFERCGFAGRAHGSYIQMSGDVSFKGVKFLSTKGEGHSLKVSAKNILIENSTIAALNGHNSRGIDLFGGGVLVVRNSIIQQGGNSDNTDMIGLAMEPNRRQKGVHSVLLENNWLIFDNEKHLLFFSKGKLFNGNKLGDVVVRNNKIVGMAGVNIEGVTFEGNEVFSAREDAGLVEYDGSLDSFPLILK
jgi:hypothetical protein